MGVRCGSIPIAEMGVVNGVLFFFKQKTAYEVRISDWSSDVCSSDLDADVIVLAPDAIPAPGWATQLAACCARDASIATATSWCNAGEAAAWPRCGEVMSIPADLDRVAREAGSKIGRAHV